MTLYEFNRLSESEQGNYVFTQGTYVCTDLEGPSNFYTLGEFYVEVRIDEGRTTIIEVKAFNTGERYDRMIAHMDVVNLFDWRPTQ